MEAGRSIVEKASLWTLFDAGDGWDFKSVKTGDEVECYPIQNQKIPQGAVVYQVWIRDELWDGKFKEDMEDLGFCDGNSVKFGVHTA